MANYAFIIGINDYEPASDGLRPLRGAVKDATKFRDWLMKPDGGNVPETNLFQLYSEQGKYLPTKSEFDKEFERFLKTLQKINTEQDRFYFYFSGHGVADPTEIQNNFLCLANWTKLFSDRALSVAEGIAFISFLGLFREIIFLFDCCRTTYIRAKKGFFGPPNIRMGQLVGKASQFVAFAVPFQAEAMEAPVSENPDAEVRGIFTETLLDALNGAAAGQDGIVDHESLTRYLRTQVPQRAQDKQLRQEIPEINFTMSGSSTKLVFATFDVNAVVSVEFSAGGTIDIYDYRNTKMGTYAVTSAPQSVELNLPVGVYSIVRNNDRSSEKFFRVEGKDQKLSINY